MRFLRFICNVLLLFVTSIFICSVSVGAYDLVACQDNLGLDSKSSIEVIHVVPSSDSVSIVDTYTFWATDIAAGEKCEAKYRIRNWGNEWWQEHMRWADVALDATIAFFKPLIVPVAQINAVKDYYLTEDYDINSVYHRYTAAEADSLVTDEELYELYFIFNRFTFSNFDIEILKAHDGSRLIDFDYAHSEKRDTEIDLENVDSSGLIKETEFMSWAKRHKRAYNTDWKLKKYNQSIYTKYFNKFIFSKIVDVTKNGETFRTEIRTIKSSVVVLVYVQFISFILALIFVIKYPVALLQRTYRSKTKKKKR